MGNKVSEYLKFVRCGTIQYLLLENQRRQHTQQRQQNHTNPKNGARIHVLRNEIHVFVTAKVEVNNGQEFLSKYRSPVNEE